MLSPKDAGAQAKLAEAGWYADDVATAESAARAALKIDKAQPLACEILGRLLVLKAEQLTKEREEDKASELYEEAHRILKRLVKTQPKNAIGLKYLAKIEQAWKQWDEASAKWEAYQALRPN